MDSSCNGYGDDSEKFVKDYDTDYNNPQLEQAATKIQASFRGYKTRQDLKDAVPPTMEELGNINLTDPDLNKAATQIQASFRGYKTRQNLKENQLESSAKEELDGIDLKDPELEKAATQIQASFRGYKTRQNLKENESPANEELDGIDLTDPELEKAATQIQASFRGYKTRQNLKENESPANEELDGIDLTDPELEKAATQIQASFRGYKTRQNLKENESPANEELDGIDLNDPELEKAATQIQASFRGYMARQSMNKDTLLGKEDDIAIDLNDPELEKAATHIQSLFRGYKTRQSLKNDHQEQKLIELNDFDLNDPDLHQAASLIQAKFRDYQSRINVADCKSLGKDDTDDIDLNDPEVLKAATLIQASFRGFQTRKGIHPSDPEKREGNDTYLNNLETTEGNIVNNGEDKEVVEEAAKQTEEQGGTRYIVEPSIIVTDTETNTVLQDTDFDPSASDNKNTLEVSQFGDSDWSNVSSRDASPSPDHNPLSAPVATAELNSAATKIQSIFRGYRTRQQIKRHRTNGPVSSRNKSKRRGSGMKEKENAAATKIQAAFRGFKTRKHMKSSPNKPSYRSLPHGLQQRRDSLEAAQMEARRGSLTRDVLMASVLEERIQHRELTPEDPALIKAAVTLQAGVRGYLTRKHMAEKSASDSSNTNRVNAEAAAATKIQAGFRGYKTRKMLRERAQASLDLSDPAVIQAAVRIQAALRGHLARKELRGAS
ncbi:abnormal spindle-like microcephaly-associated protein homolog [Penaeus japonicus]|uniref:abnormal spindle-like microcephaly-associated protein homolog n=1 Tax=Penaeus japonicus TaxID=27405 RepID=UPI001C70C7C1|nr:abnormal spindle-like microcephaly-associated protein homolog [Penaeus japonicus]XP_042871835.1 abnormal spindle-like microcephaly-associated protein homolog [Penaeus japonicus]XP_042871836.1 abnormal spindle-like microcephaly-associated protein homolog [Penaeus japonicus]XP_042871837.1 abnormal spindle-like microcephaly-associated protein homolog [Penaeus japonicus]XP_042871838.1 abnormal spindle-like microcephaly-associated protein homolog [Penaeus japonicus]